MWLEKKQIDELPVDRQKIKNIVRSGGCIFLVGGSCRDLLLESRPRDFDFVVAGISENKLERLFPGIKKVGKKFPVFRKGKLDFSLIGQKNCRDNICKLIKDNLATRDFSINAMAVLLPEGELIDPLEGLKDLRKGRIRALPGAFDEDPLRIYRAARFSSELTCTKKDFIITKATLKRMRQKGERLKNVPAERIFKELRFALNSYRPAHFFSVLSRANILKIDFPELAQLQKIKCQQENGSQRSIFEQTMKGLNNASNSNISGGELVKFGILVHGFRELTFKEREGKDREGKHNKRASEKMHSALKQLGKFCSRLKLPEDWQKSGRQVIKYYHKALNWKKTKPKLLLKMLNEVSRSPLTVKKLEEVVKCLQASYNSEKKEYQGLADFADRLYKETGAYCVQNEFPEGPKLGRALFQYRRQWIEKNINKM